MMTSKILPVLLIAVTRSDINTYTNTVTTNSVGVEKTWESTSNFVPQSATSYGTTFIGESMSMTFDMTFHGRSDSVAADKVENFFRVGFDAHDGNHCWGSLAHYPSMWIASDSEVPYMVLTEDDCTAVTTELHGLGALRKDYTYHFNLSWNATHLSVYMKNYNVTDGQVAEGTNRTWSQSWTRSATHLDYIGEEVPVWFMTNKFSTQQYNIGNGTFSNIVISTEYETAEPTWVPTTDPSADPTVDPTKDPTKDPTSDPTTVPTPGPTNNVEFKQSTTVDTVVNKTNTESGSVSPLTIAIIVIVVLFVVLACHAVFLCGRYRKRKEALKDEDELEEIVDDEGNINTDLPIHAPDERPPQDDEDSPEPIYEEPLDQLSKPDDKMLVCG